MCWEEWIKITPDNVPIVPVLATNAQGDYAVGEIKAHIIFGYFVIDGDHYDIPYTIENITHFAYINRPVYEVDAQVNDIISDYIDHLEQDTNDRIGLNKKWQKTVDDLINKKNNNEKV